MIFLSRLYTRIIYLDKITHLVGILWKKVLTNNLFVLVNLVELLWFTIRFQFRFTLCICIKSDLIGNYLGIKPK